MPRGAISATVVGGYTTTAAFSATPPQGGRGGASGAAALVGVALCCPSAPAPSSAEAHSLRGWRDL